jgi:adenylate cyclase class IV
MSKESITTKELEKVDELLAAVEELKAYCCEKETDVSCDCTYRLSETENVLRWLREDLNYLRESFYKHKEGGHLPPITTVEQLSRALKVLGLEEEYEVKKKQIYLDNGVYASTKFEIAPKESPSAAE